MVKTKQLGLWLKSLKTKPLKQLLKITFLGISVMSLSPSFAHNLEIFTLHEREVFLNGESARVCYLDDLKKLEVQIGARLDESMDNHDIEDVMKGFEKRLNEAIMCQQQAMDLGVEKLPAIVINHQFVAYGLDSVNSAMKAYQQETENAQ